MRPNRGFIFTGGRTRLCQVANYSSILDKHKAKLLDIEQASCVTHSTFTLNMLVSVGDNSDAMVTDMLLNSQNRNIKMDVVVVTGEDLRGDDKPQVRSPKLTVAFSRSSNILMTYRVAGTRCGTR